MGAPDILIYLHGLGLTATADGGRLFVEPKSAITDEAREIIRANKAALLSALSPTTGNAELDGLIAMVADDYRCPEDEHRLMIETARGDLEGALLSFRLMARPFPAPGEFPKDDRITCNACGNLARGRCQAAAQGLMEDTYRGYSPVPDVLRRCEYFKLKGN